MASQQHIASDRVARLQQMSLFGGIRDEIVAAVLERAKPVHVAAGGFFFREGDAADALYLLEHGAAQVIKGDPARARVLRTLHAGDCFGEMSLMDLAPRSASVRALEDCSALAITSGCLHDIYALDVEQFAMIEMNMGREVSRRLRESDAAASRSAAPGAATDERG